MIVHKGLGYPSNQPHTDVTFPLQVHWMATRAIKHCSESIGLFLGELEHQDTIIIESIMVNGLTKALLTKEKLTEMQF